MGCCAWKERLHGESMTTILLLTSLFELFVLFAFPVVTASLARSLRHTHLTAAMPPQIEIYTPRDRELRWPSTLAHDRDEVYPPLIMHIKSGDDEFENLFSL